MDCTIRVAKTQALISFAVTAKLICVFVFAYAKNRFSHDAAHLQVAVFPVYYAANNSDLATTKCLIRHGAQLNKLNSVRCLLDDIIHMIK